MKKNIITLAFITICCSAFALERISSLTFGYNSRVVLDDLSKKIQNHGNIQKGNYYDQYVRHGFNISPSIGTIANSGFTFLLLNDFTIFGKEKVTQTRGSLRAIAHDPMATFGWNAHVLFGYTHKFLDNKIYLSTLAGLMAGFGMKKNGMDRLFVGGSIHIAVDWYFLKFMGVSFQITESPACELGRNCYTNFFTIQVGPKFRF
ncbi:MAG: DUF2715 domain-containing protein [Treponema sp.]|nr:DUF2715 domain-containing protein [Treponema sp.]